MEHVGEYQIMYFSELHFKIKDLCSEISLLHQHFFFFFKWGNLLEQVTQPNLLFL